MTDRQRHKLRGVTGLYPQQHRSPALLPSFEGTAEIGRGRNLFAAGFDDHISILETARGGNAIRVNIEDCYSIAD